MRLLATFASACVACGSGFPKTCVWSVNGAAQPSFECRTLADNRNGAPMVFEVDAPTVPPRWGELFIQFYWNDLNFETGTRTADTVSYAEIKAVRSGEAWAAFRNSGRPASEPDQGDFALTIRDAGDSDSAGYTVWYGSRFSLDATLLPLPGSAATAAISVHIEN
jgi:hypothetical protein